MRADRRVVVTGASGLVGSGVVEELRRAGYQVIGVARRGRPEGWDDVDWVRADLGWDLAPALDRCRPFGALVHLAAAIDPPAGSALPELRAVNMEACERLFRYCGTHGVGKVIFTSSLGVLARPLASPITERDPVGAVLPYHVSKYWGELALRQAAAEHGFVGIVLRISSPVGRRFALLPATVVRQWLTLAAEEKPIGLWGRGSRTQDFVAVEDIGRAVVAALERARASDVFHIGGGRQTSMRELAAAIAALGGVSVESVNRADPKESERWDLDLGRAWRMLDYEPRLSVFDHLPALWEQARCAVPSSPTSTPTSTPSPPSPTASASTMSTSS
jgi:UDP-glucose 4-epimerase